MESQTGKTALITGATSGIGLELARLFAQDGYNLVLVARQEDSLRRVATDFEQQYNIRATTIAKDLMETNAPEEIYQQTRQQGITVDVLVNNAGMGEYGKFATETDLQKELGIIQLNATSLVHLTKLYLKEMVTRNEGKILMLASVVSAIPNPLMAVYGATKSFIYSFAEALRNELKDTQITVTALMPGATATDFFNKAGAQNAKVTDSDLADPAKVAKDGYDALMQGKDKVVSGFKNKMQVAMSHVLPDTVVSEAMRNMMNEKGYEEEADEEHESLTPLAIGLGLATVVLAAGIFLTASYTNANWYEKRRYKEKLKSLTNALTPSLN
ncbi:SDR family oxidoreductase [Nibrella viscosa]|uniref:SDR family oxidoreductase n=1 Tax=Nibrella viscosa TaxID=1084524 RepID=A0ABP8JV13_9BACT